MASSSRSWKYDVFLSFRGEDTRKTFVDHLYYALQRRLIRTYKDDETLLRGDTIGPSLVNAIEDSQIALIIFSENYATSSWCLDELAYIMKCNKERGQIVMPVFYHVDPTDVRKQKKKYGEAFAKHDSENNNKVQSWRKALVDASNIAGWETNHIANGHEAKAIEDIVGIILDKLLSLHSTVDENLVGMGTRLQDLISQLKMESGGVRMVGIWGIGGGGKTTLASSLYIEMSGKFDSCCFVENIKEKSKKHGMETLQEKMLSTIFDKKVKVQSVDIGKLTIKRMLGSRNVLVILDDVDDRRQLEALAGSHDWFGDGSRIIITTRDKHLLNTRRVDVVSHVSLLSHDEAIRLFNKNAYNENNLVEDYDMLSLHVVSYADGLPLALIVLGSFLYDKDTNEWISTLDRLKDSPEMEIVEKLKISYDGLKPLEKELFLDIACFFRGESTDEVMEILEANGLHPGIGVNVLKQKALITVSKWRKFDMHDLVQEMGLYIVKGEHPNNPEKHSRIWRPEDIEDMCSGNLTKENDKIVAIICHECPSNIYKLVSNTKMLRLLNVSNHNENIEGPDFLSNELRYMVWQNYPASTLPESFQARKLVVLKLRNTLQEELWKGCKSLPCLKELDLSLASNLITTPDFAGLRCLQKLTLDTCTKLKKIHPSLGNHTSLVYVYVRHCMKLKEFPDIVDMKKLKILEILYCNELRKFPTIKANMESLVHLSLEHVEIEVLPLSVGKYCTNLNSLKLEKCSTSKSTEGNFLVLKLMRTLNNTSSILNKKMPKDIYEKMPLKELRLYSTTQFSIPHEPSFLTRLTLSNCGLKDGEIPCHIGDLSNLQELNLSKNEFSRLNFSLLQFTQLELLNLADCKNLVELPELPTSIAILKADDCHSLTFDGNINTNCKRLCQVSLRNVKSVNGGGRLLQSMLQGNAVENRCMLLQLKNLEIPKGIIPRLLDGKRYTLQLPHNWYNDFSGFLMCACGWETHKNVQYITMENEKGGSTSMDSQIGVSKESFGDVATWVGYVSFSSLEDTTWWDQTSTSIEFSINFKSLLEDIFDNNEESQQAKPESGPCSAFGVALVSKTNESCQIGTTYSSSEYSDDYTCNFSIPQDSKSTLKCRFNAHGLNDTW